MVARLFRTGSEQSQGKIRYLSFRPYMGNAGDEYWQPEDKGYYFKMPNSNIRILQLTLRDNGFNETSSSKMCSLLWNTG
jgi:hypothetical protein